ncbi:MAG TPA: kelch repeat-containing protein [Kofleriaceae bacterium]|nr:kelch repeat-containing protein [Kofleriaceae bacterium]
MSRWLAPLAALAPAVLGACRAQALPDAATTPWTIGMAMPRSAQQPGVTANGLDVIVAGGYDLTPAGALEITSRVDVLDTTSGRWLLPGTIPDAPVHWTDVDLAALGDTIYLAGGLEGAQHIAHGETYAFDPLQQAWKMLAAMPAGLERGAAGVVAAPGRIYLLGGASSTGPVATCLAYDIPTGTWVVEPELPAARSHPAAMRRSDGSLIVAGGFAGPDASDPRADVWRLPPEGAVPRAWTPVAAMPEPRGGCAYGAVLGHLVCAGGVGPGGPTADVEVYDPFETAQPPWTIDLPMPEPRALVPGAAVGGRLFVPGGSPGLAIAPTRTLYIYAPLDTSAP